MVQIPSPEKKQVETSAAEGGAHGAECDDDDEEEAEEKPPGDEDDELAGCADAGARLLQRSATRPP